jgi:hypothetical protein
MIRRASSRLLSGVAVLVCVAGLSACGSSSPSTSGSATTSPPPGSGDTAICQLVSKATAAYNARNYDQWRLYMAQVGASADASRYPPLRKYAEQVKNGIKATTTTTTSSSKNRSGFVAGGALAIAGGFVGLQHVCARLPAS